MKIFLGILCLLALIGILFYIGYRLYAYALKPNRKQPFRCKDTNVEFYDEKAWLLQNGEEIEILTPKEGYILSGSHVCNDESDTCVLLFHGYRCDRFDMAEPAKRFYEKGYSVFLADARGHGNSEGNYIGMGFPERMDVLLWIEKLKRKYHYKSFILYGISMGAATVLLTCAQDMPDEVICAIEDSSYTSAYEIFKRQIHKQFHVPVFLVLPLAGTVCRIFAHYTLKDPDCIKAVERSKIPTLFIHGENDDFVPCEMGKQLFERAACQKELLLIPNARHARGRLEDAKLYQETVDRFIQKYKRKL